MKDETVGCGCLTIVAVLILVLVGSVWSCHSNERRFEDQWKPLVQTTLTNGWNSRQIIEYDSIADYRSVFTNGQFKSPYVGVYIYDPMKGYGKHDVTLDTPLSPNAQFMSMGNSLTIGGRLPVPSKYLPGRSKAPQTIIVFKQIVTSRGLLGMRGNSRVDTTTSDTYVTFVDIGTHRVSPTVRFSSEEGRENVNQHDLRIRDLIIRINQ
jgi:hypothetical protein